MRLITFFLIVFVLSGCRKTKLKDEYAIFEGKWKWVSTEQEKKLISNGNSSYTTILSSQYPDSYYLEFAHKGKVAFIKNEETLDKYRIQFSIFDDNCNVYENCYLYRMHFNGSIDKRMTGNVSADTLSVGSDDLHLPLKNYSDANYEYTYSYLFVKVN